jgi:hypothetical protein
MSGRAGIDKLLREAADPVQAERAEQLPLLPSLDAPDEAAPSAGIADTPSQAGEGGKRVRGRNRRTDEMVRYLFRFGEGPLVGLAKIVNSIRFREEQGELHGLPDFRPLARALGMETAEAATFWRQCAGDLAPYMHQKLPMAIDVTGDSAGSLVVVNLGATSSDPETDLGDLLGGHLGEIIDVEPDSEENQ